MGVRSVNNSLQQFLDTFVRSGTDAVTLPTVLMGLTATGGVISDYTTPPGAVYSAHIFTSSGTFAVSSIGSYGSNVDYLVVAGGGGGGDYGGGGAGGYRSSVTGESSGGGNSAESALSVSPGPYTVTIGGGGGNAQQGTPSVFGIITSTGGGNGTTYNGTGGSGGSGGGTGDYPRGGRIGTADNYPGPTAQGFPGGQGASDQTTYTWGGGGGGAGAAGQGAPIGPNPSPHPQLSGGNGIRTAIAGPSYPIGTPGPASPGGTGGAPSTAVVGGWLAGGGGGYTAGFGGAGGGGAGISNPGSQSTGGGGSSSASGGSGIVVVRYQIGQLTATAKATGGAISYYGGKTIHTFTSSGTFATAPNWTSATVEYIVVGGGGAGGGAFAIGGAGGAGGYLTGTTPIGAHPVSTSIQVGAGGVRGVGLSASSSTGGTSGTPSYFGAPITATGGGRGSLYSVQDAATGGSGGGGCGQDGTQPAPRTLGASGTPGQGFAGGNGAGPGSSPPRYGGGGGGGAGGAGGNGTNSAGGPGGVGVQLPATFRNPASQPGPGTTPISGGGLGTPGPGSTYFWVAGGGGGAVYGGENPSPIIDGGAGGAGGGGKGSNSVGESGVENTGGGGGGGDRIPSGSFSYGASGNGGSGIVLIAYPS